MDLTCYHCHQTHTYAGWNPFRRTVTCGCCGRAVYVSEAVERVHGKAVGDQALNLLRKLGNVGERGRDSLAHLADLTLRRLEHLLKEAA